MQQLLSTLVILVLVPVVAQATTYYVNSASGNDSNDGLTTATAWRTISKVNAMSYQPGDVISFKRGEVWRDRLTVSSSGTAGHPVAYTAYGSGDLPTISGADPISSWNWLAGTVFWAAVAVEPYQLFWGDQRLSRNWGAGSSIAVGEWDWSDSTLYFNVGSSPASAPLEGTRGDWSGQHGVLIRDRDHVTIDHLHITRFRVDIYVTGETAGSDFFTLVNCRLSDAFYHGIQGWDQTYPNNNVTISDNQVFNSGGSGINWTKFGNNGLISRNLVTGNCQLTDEETGSGEHTYSAGIYLFGNRVGISNIVIEHNVVQGCGTGLIPGDFAGNGIWVDQTLGGNIVRYNVVSNNTNSGIIAEDTPLGGMIYYNLVYDNGKGVQPLDGYGLFLSRDSQHWQVYNNTVYDNRVGLCVADWLDDGPPQNNVFTNNIIDTNETTEIIVLHGSESLSNVFSFNTLDAGSDFVRWGSSSFDTMVEWEAAASWRAIDNNDEDPMFALPQNGDLRLRDASPCLNAGNDVGLSQDILGDPVVDPPTIGAFEFPYDWVFEDGFESGSTVSWSLSY